MQNTRKQTKTNGKKCQKATTRFALWLWPTRCCCLSLGLDPPERSMVRELCWLWLCVAAFSHHDSLHCELRSAVRLCANSLICSAVRLVPVLSAAAAAYNGYWQPAKGGGGGVKKGIQRAKKFHLRVSLLDTFSIHQLCLSIKLITNSIKTH